MPSTAPVDGRRGELRIYLGAAPGAGKTFAVLGEAHRRRERGTEVVVGLVETHGRDRTASLLEGLEVVPRRVVRHRELEVSEMDVDAVLARRPEVAVVDELAHTNAPGSRNEKRWQDVEELLEAGIDVLSTVNVQHLESLNDVVERITGVRQRETVPDEVVRRAEQVELVDITPEALRRRLAHGNVYPAHRIDAALGNYFRLGNLTALRELALLWVADQVDVALQRYRSEKEITDTWETRERVVVSVTGGPESETLIRRARRIATRAGAELLVVHVLRGDGLSGATPEHIARSRRITEDVGATFHSVVGDDVPTALLEFARGVNATQLVLGTSRRSRVARAFDEGIGAAVVQESGAIDVHMVTHDESRRGLRWRTGVDPLSLQRRLIGWSLSLVLPAAVTALGTLWRDELDFSTDLVAFLLVTCVVAIAGGLGPALFCAVLGAGLLNYFFTEPYYSLAVRTPENVITLAAMVIVATVVALTVDRAARLAEQGARARTEAALLASYSRTVLTSPYPLTRLLEKIRENFGLESVVLAERRDGAWKCVERAGSDLGPVTEVAVTGDVRLRLSGRVLPASDQRVLEAAAGQTFVALRQQRMAAEALHAQRKAETSELRTALLSAVGHDLRTPLTSIKAAIGSLRDDSLPLSEEDVSELMATVEESADRLTGLVDNLLDSSRLATGSVEPVLRPVGYYEVVARALTGIGGEVSVVVAEDLPPVLADLGLLERVVANVVDNALRHGSPSPVAVRASSHGSSVELRVVDHGPGLPKKAEHKLFAPFQRLGDRSATPGVGLGLSVAKGFTAAMGGEISAEDTPGGGLTVVISLPVYEESSR
ncbi:sensor histidine kinase KdpD [Lentzea californiensis]|uniref:sensor histidine kinase KdpD n=1 Tax=Lentzea californiensis TaxID=438851 RepID=UPI002166BE0A|nr:sensor histidine kinase KdpD [Lentzea californiensis]MCR3749197.1 two-component system, OmpR family, sensor histidine kinase KdpD [Lentzea californiensis]